MHFDGSVSTLIIRNEVDSLHILVAHLEVKGVHDVVKEMDTWWQLFGIVGLEQSIVYVHHLFAIVVGYNLDLIEGVLVVVEKFGLLACELDWVVAEEN